MSDVESYSGKLIPVDMEGLTEDEWISKMTGLIEIPDWASSWLDAAFDSLYRKFYRAPGGIWYEIQADKLDPEGFVRSTKNDDGSYDFIISWYNGGASMNEVLDEVVSGENH